MDMTEKDNDLLLRFFHEHRQEIADNGFSQRVMRRLPAPALAPGQSRLWRAVCLTAGLVFFFFTHGWEQLLPIFRILYGECSVALHSVHITASTLLVLLGILSTLAVVAAYNVWDLEE